jgi:malonate decarboxylase beta subunit
MAIVASCCTAIVMSEEGRLGLSGPEVIETARGVEEFDSRDRALVWRTTGAKHRYLMGDCDTLVDDDLAAFRAALVRLCGARRSFDLDELEREHELLGRRIEAFGRARDAFEIWKALGLADPEAVPEVTTADLVLAAEARHAR